MKEIIFDTLLDTARLVPFLFLTYLLMELLEHMAADKMQNIVKKGGKMGPVFGGLLGIVPQCGFSTAAASLYAGRVITLGTLIAIFLSTSDEMLPILISESSIGTVTILKILAVKVIIGIAAGFLVDLLFRIFMRKKSGWEEHEHIHELCEHDHCHCGQNDSAIRSAFVHTVKIAFFILLITFVVNTILFLTGEDTLKQLFMNQPVIGELAAGVVGLIPNCAASVVLTQLFVENAISFAACMTGLLVNSGMGLLVLFRTNRHPKENISILAILYAAGVVAGLLLEFIPAGAWR